MNQKSVLLKIKSGKNRSILKYTVTYFVLIGIGFVFIYPVFYMLVNSFMSADDLSDPSVYWLPTQIYFGNFVQAYKTLDFSRSIMWSFLVSVVPALLQTVMVSVIAFGLSRFQLPGRKLILVLALITLVIPSQITSIPRYVMFDQYGLLNTPLPFYFTALLGQGIRSAIFILVFYQFYSSYPISFDEAAELDGAGKFTIYYKISLPMSSTAAVLSFLLSFVWYWNETTDSNMLFGSAIKTLPLQLADFAAKYESLYGSVDSNIGSVNEAVSMAGTLLSVIPLIVVYVCLQKQFIESIERTGLTGE